MVNIGTLILEGGCIRICGNVFSLTCQRLIKKEEAMADYDIAIMPSISGFGCREGPMDGLRGLDGKDGINGVDGIAPLIDRVFLRHF